MRYQVYIGFSGGAATSGELLLEDGRCFHLDHDEVARLNTGAAVLNPGAVIAAIVAEREAPAVCHG